MGIRSRQALPPTFLFPFHGEMSGERTKSRDRSSTRNPVWEQDARESSVRERASVKSVRSPSISLYGRRADYSEHVRDVRINKKPGSLNLAVRSDSFASAKILRESRTLTVLNVSLNIPSYIITVLFL